MKLRPTVLALALFSCFIPTALSAQDTSITWQVTPWIGTGVLGGDIGRQEAGSGITVDPAEINNAPVVGLFAGVQLFGHLMLEGIVSFAPSTMLNETEIQTNGEPFLLKQGYDLDIVTFGGNVGWAFSASKTQVVPYLSVGAGAVSFSPDETAKQFSSSVESTTDVMFDFGGGLGIPISETVQLRLDVRDYIVSTNGEFSLFPSDDSTTLNTFVLSAGVTLHSR